ncbi:hypothetical protein D3C83_237970 [compost metagenome]
MKKKSVKGARDAAMTKGAKTGRQHSEDFGDTENEDLLPGEIEDLNLEENYDEEDEF